MAARTIRVLPRLRTVMAVLVLGATALPLLRGTADAVVGDKVAINDVSVAEGSPSGTKTANFSVTLTPGSATLYGGEMVTWETTDGTAIGGASCTSGVDYVTANGTLNWGVNDQTKTKTVAIQICQDAQAEPNEQFTITLESTNPTLLTSPGDSTGIGSIFNDDGTAPTLSSAATSVTEGNTGTKPMAWTVLLNSAPQPRATTTPRAPRP
jgi:hypothetical protein